MITKTEQVWRHLLVGAFERDQRQWPSVTALADDLQLAVSTSHRALEHPGEIGALDISRAGGLVLRDPGKLLMLWAGARRLQRDIVDRFHVSASAVTVETTAPSPTAILGGFGAVVAHRGGNRIADYTTVLFYGDPSLDLERSPEPLWPWDATEVIVVEPDPRLAIYGRVTPISQAWVDLFTLGGWQADRFVHDLAGELIHDGTQPVLSA
ncbi:hypothetical protein BH20ACT8_BH20ACT8_09030 [soil metagenome]|jgi:hypothetical protein